MIDKLNRLTAESHFLSVRLSGDVNVRDFLQAVRTRLKYICDGATPFCYVWFRDGDDVILSFGANRLVIDFLKGFVEKHTSNHYQQFEIVHSSHGAVRFQRELTELYNNRAPSRGKHHCRGSRS
jgi:hypothetical protein